MIPASLDETRVIWTLATSATDVPLYSASPRGTCRGTMTRVQNNRSLLKLQPNFPFNIFWSDWSHTGLPANGKLPGWSLRRLRSYSAAVLPGPSWVNWCNCYGYAWHYLALIRIFNLTLRPVEVSGVMKDFLMCSEEIWTDPSRGDYCNTHHQPLNNCLIRISTLRLSW